MPASIWLLQVKMLSLKYKYMIRYCTRVYMGQKKWHTWHCDTALLIQWYFDILKQYCYFVTHDMLKIIKEWHSTFVESNTTLQKVVHVIYTIKSSPHRHNDVRKIKADTSLCLFTDEMVNCKIAPKISIRSSNWEHWCAEIVTQLQPYIFPSHVDPLHFHYSASTCSIN